ncbi:MAG: single-stranded DNA-binding protein [Clostridia bacterium]|nr:single-stranded DNA-binding protein [Clostridia bacterium]
MNKVILIGNLTRDPELRTTSTGISVCTFGLAVNRRFQNQQGVREVDFFNVTAWRQTGELCARYLTKGRKCCIVGSVQIRTYDAQDGTKKTVVDVIADEVEFLPSSQSGQRPGDDIPPPPEPTGYMPRSNKPAASAPDPIDDDQLPF